MTKIAVLITCHNRKEKTLACLGALFSNLGKEHYDLHVILVDDGSTDKTSFYVQQQFPEVEILHGDGTLYWTRGTHNAFARAFETGFDGYLWLNDDTILYPSAIRNLLISWQDNKVLTEQDAIFVGTTQDPVSGKPTYGGVIRKSRFKLFDYALQTPGVSTVKCDTMNGNCVFVPHAIAEKIGNLDPRFEHAMGDTDYGLRAKKAGIPILLISEYVGVCARNIDNGSFKDSSLSLQARLVRMLHPKGLPFRSWYIFTREHGGLLWPIYCVAPYVNLIVKSLINRIVRS